MSSSQCVNRGRACTVVNRDYSKHYMSTHVVWHVIFPPSFNSSLIQFLPHSIPMQQYLSIPMQQYLSNVVFNKYLLVIVITIILLIIC